MMEPARGLRLVHEAQAKLFFFVGFLAPEGNGFYGNEPVDLRVACFIDHAHGAAAEFADDLVTAKLLCIWLLHGCLWARIACHETLGDSYYVSFWTAAIPQVCWSPFITPVTYSDQTPRPVLAAKCPPRSRAPVTVGTSLRDHGFYDLLGALYPCQRSRPYRDSPFPTTVCYRAWEAAGWASSTRRKTWS